MAEPRIGFAEANESSVALVPSVTGVLDSRAVIPTALRGAEARAAGASGARGIVTPSSHRYVSMEPFEKTLKATRPLSSIAIRGPR